MAQTYEGTAERVIDDAETLNDAKLRTKQLAEQDAREKVADYIKHFTKDRNFTFSGDEITAITDSVLKFVDVQYGKAIIYAKVTVQVDDNDILSWLSKYSQEKTALVAENEKLKRQIAELKRQLGNNQPNNNQITSKVVSQNEMELSKQKLIEGWKLHGKRDYTAAIRLYDEAIRLNPYNADAYHNRGVAFRVLGYTANANEDFAKAKELGW